MATYRDIVYLVLDEIKASNGDSNITEEHVIFLANQYRLFLIEQKKKKEGESSLSSSSNEQTICIDLERVNAVPGIECAGEMYLRSIQEIPEIVSEDSIKVSLEDLFNIMTAYVSNNRFKYVGYNKYMQNIIYCTLGPDNKLYFNAQNPQFKYLQKARITGIFEDAQAAAELACDASTNGKCGIMDVEFPLETPLIPSMIELIVKELLGVNYRPKDEHNNAADDLADIASFIRRNMKAQTVKQVTS